MANEAKNLDDVKNILYKSFSKAADKVDTYAYDVDGFIKTQRFLNEIADKIMSVEQQIAMNELIKKAGESDRDLELDLDKRVIRSAAPATGSKIKSLG